MSCERRDTLSARNIPHIDVLPVVGINVYDILRRDTLVLTKDAVKHLEARPQQRAVRHPRRGVGPDPTAARLRGSGR